MASTYTVYAVGRAMGVPAALCPQVYALAKEMGLYGEDGKARKLTPEEVVILRAAWVSGRRAVRTVQEAELLAIFAADDASKQA